MWWRIDGGALVALLICTLFSCFVSEVVSDYKALEVKQEQQLDVVECYLFILLTWHDVSYPVGSQECE